MKHRVCNGSRGRSLRSLADAQRLVSIVRHQVDIDLRYFVKPQDWVARPIAACNCGRRKADLFFQRPACGLNYSPFDLGPHAVRVDDQSGVTYGNGMLQSDFPAFRIDVDLEHDPDVARQVLEPRKT